MNEVHKKYSCLLKQSNNNSNVRKQAVTLQFPHVCATHNN